MKKEFKQPELYTLGAKSTNETTPYAINPDYNGAVYCPYCRKSFVNAQEYENHKVNDYKVVNGVTTNESIGTECPRAPKGDNTLQAEMRLLS